MSQDAAPYEVMSPLARDCWVRMLTWDKQQLHDVVRDRSKHPDQRIAARSLLEILNRKRNTEV